MSRPAAPPFSRRRFLASAAGAVAAASWARLPVVSAADLEAPASKKRALRLAHLTDVHVQPELKAADGLAACLRAVQAMKDSPTLVLNTGDSVMDVFGKDAARAKVQADLFRTVLKAECSVRVEHAIGNHDVWGWNKAKSGTTGDEPLWGKNFALDLYGLKARYRSFDLAGWHFVVLDSVFPTDGGYTARLDDEQFDWLAKDLAATAKGTPVCVMSHIPIMSVTPYLDGQNEKTGNWAVPGAWMHIDARRLVNLFRKHPNVRLCLSGHEHQYDRCLYNDVWYVCGGAVCGNWWKGEYLGTEPGYGVLDLYADGTFDARYATYGWKAAAPA